MNYWMTEVSKGVREGERELISLLDCEGGSGSMRM